MDNSPGKCNPGDIKIKFYFFMREGLGAVVEEYSLQIWAEECQGRRVR